MISNYFYFITTFLLVIPMFKGQSIIPDYYNKAFRPKGLNPDDPLEVKFSIKINGINEIDMEKMSIKMHMYIRATWVDERLIYPEEHINSSYETDNSMSLNSDIIHNIWAPDHYFWATRSISAFKLLQQFMGVKLFKNKRIFTSSMIEIEIACPMNFRNYPFDTQNCLIYIGSYFYNIHEVNFKWDTLGLAIDKAVKEQLAGFEFKMTRFNNTRCKCVGCFPDVTPCIRMELILKRHYLIHLVGYFIPSSLFMMVAWTSFFWPADVIPGRTVLVITSLLTVSSLYASSRTDSPKTSYVKALDAWMFFGIVVGVLTLFQYAIVLQWMKKRDALKNSQVIPVGKQSKMEHQMTIYKYERYQYWTEMCGRVGVPVLFVFFNIVYWPFFI